ncbi:MAG: 2-dehydro-3-deoxy-6-phosphogalactonate aldolase [Clostridia bacterium BRH_c25]|nr:MAG: 2-dehydro-3-deoxy-6-phosphogalactonate aldolase [Clostridia bacterium BRH_c25]
MIPNEKLIAIIRNVSPDYIMDIASVIKTAGIGAVEVSLSEPERGFACIERLKKQYCDDDFAIGAGTVSKKSEIDKLSALGVTYILTPGYDEEIVSYALRKKIDILPGVLTPSDVQKAVNQGIILLKLFPANAFDMGYIKSLKGPFPQTDYIAVGGVNKNNAAEFLKAGFKGIAAGSNLVPQDASIKDLTTVKQAAEAFVEAVRGEKLQCI